MKLGPKAAATALTVSAALALTACGGAANSSSAAGAATALTLGTIQDVRSWDPAQAHVGHILQPYQAVYDTLILREPDGKLSPMLATAWKYNAANTKLTVDLRSDVTFSDGATFDAEAAKANMDHFKKANGPQMAQLNAVKDVAVVDADTIDINLSTPDPALEYFLSQAAGLMGSPKALGTDGIKTEPAGSGPYVMDKAASVKDSQTVFTARKDYWNKDLQKYRKLTFKILTDPTARTNALVSGQVDATLLDPKNGKQAEGAKMKLAANEVDWQGLLLLDRDGAKNPALQNVKVRQAINYAFDRKTILDQVLLGQGTPTSQPFGKASGAWTEELENYYTLRSGQGQAAPQRSRLRNRRDPGNPQHPRLPDPDFRGPAAARRRRYHPEDWRRAHQHLHIRCGRTEVHHDVLLPLPGPADRGHQPDHLHQGAVQPVQEHVAGARRQDRRRAQRRRRRRQAGART